MVVRDITLAGGLGSSLDLGDGSLFEPGRWRLGSVVLMEFTVSSGSGRRPVVLPTCASHREPSRLDEALVVLADLPYQVGFASLERKLGVGGELAAEVGEARSLGARWCRASPWLDGVLLCRFQGRLNVASLPNPRFIPTPAGRRWWAGGRCSR